MITYELCHWVDQYGRHCVLRQGHMTNLGGKRLNYQHVPNEPLPRPTAEALIATHPTNSNNDWERIKNSDG